MIVCREKLTGKKRKRRNGKWLRKIGDNGAAHGDSERVSKREEKSGEAGKRREKRSERH